MRIVSKAELLTLPSGTLIAEARGPGRFGDLVIYGGRYAEMNDFLERSINPECPGSDELMDREQDMWIHGAVYPVNEAWGHEGYYDDTMRYLVYDDADIASIMRDLAAFKTWAAQPEGTAPARITVALRLIDEQLRDEFERRSWPVLRKLRELLGGE